MLKKSGLLLSLFLLVPFLVGGFVLPAKKQTISPVAIVNAGPLNVTVPVGQEGTFTVQASSVCRTLITKNGTAVVGGTANGTPVSSGGFGPMTSQIVYVTPTVAPTDVGKAYSIVIKFYGCVGASGSINSPSMVMVPQNTQVSLAFQNSSAVYDNGTPIVSNMSLDIFEQEGTDVNNNPILTRIGSVASDASGNLTGSIIVDWSFVDANGMVSLSANLPMIGSFGQKIPSTSFQHKSNGVRISIVLFAGTIDPKSGAVGLLP